MNVPALKANAKPISLAGMILEPKTTSNADRTVDTGVAAENVAM